MSRFRRRALRPDLELHVDGRPTPAVSGQSLLGVLVAGGVWTQRSHPVTGRPEAGICGMGVCQACEVVIEGRGAVLACGVEAEDGMRVHTSATAGRTT